MNANAEFVPIAKLPYSINALGRVRSERTGLVLSHDKQGRVAFTEGKKKKLFYLGELLMAAGLMPTPGVLPKPVPESAQDLTATMAELEESRNRQRRLNAHLIALVDKLKERVTEMELERKETKSRKGRPAKVDPFWDDLGMED